MTGMQSTDAGNTSRGASTPRLSAPSAAPTEEAIEEAVGEINRPWLVVVWDDPVNLMSYVVFVFQRLFGLDKRTATDLMLQVHNNGRAVVSSGDREECEHDVRRLHEYGLWASVQREE